ncbi:DUF6920 family protein [Desulforudis sp. 1088]|uniref:DUF6920 family protein n=1 Tax=unclassified Candidatus Desulforudis TaxID=2635950 RepID=UPI003CE50828
MKLTIVAVILIALAAGVAGAVIYGVSRWQAKNDDFRAKLETARISITPTTYDAREIEGLPLPVQRYFRAVLQDGQPIVAVVRLSQQGQFRISEAEDSWRPFEATQMITTCPPGFDWDARVKMAPGVKVFVQDAYGAGTGILHAAVLGLVTVAAMRGTPEMAQGELMRYLAEGPWYPTALLPSQGVRWEAIDDSSARATLTDGDVSVSIEFCFDEEGLITTARSQSRYRAVDGVLQPTPWQGRFSAYANRAGMRIPLEGEVKWQLPDGPLPYWRGRITEIDYQWAQ